MEATVDVSMIPKPTRSPGSAEKRNSKKVRTKGTDEATSGDAQMQDEESTVEWSDVQRQLFADSDQGSAPRSGDGCGSEPSVSKTDVLEEAISNARSKPSFKDTLVGEGHQGHHNPDDEF